MDLMIWILLGVGFVAIIIGILKLLVSLKGSIKINPEKYEYKRGETIKGTITLKLRKPVEAESLNIGLVGEKKGGRSNQGNNKIFDFKKPIDTSKNYAAGEKTYNFEVTIPQDTVSMQTGNAVADSIIKSVQIISGIGSINWYLTADLDINGFNLSKKVKINIV